MRVTAAEAMGRAIAEARKAWGNTSPNPMVGCVIVDADHRFLSSGFHTAYGKSHAEVEAFSKVEDKEKLKGATVYVTLEPCAHNGQTPPCADMLAGYPIRKLVYGCDDPNPKVQGKGLEKLRQAGIEVERFDGLIPELQELAENFLYSVKARKALFAVKVASSLDGQLAMQSGESQWITSSQAREYSHFLRAGYDAVLIGANTLNSDNPKLDIRHPEFENKKNKIIVVDPNGIAIKNLVSSNTFKVHGAERVYVVTKDEHKDRLPENCVFIQADAEGGVLNWQDLKQKLYNLGIQSVLVEGGGYTIGTLLSANAVERVYLFLAPIIIGAGKGISWTKGLEIATLAEKLSLKHVTTHWYGDDLLVKGSLGSVE